MVRDLLPHPITTRDRGARRGEAGTSPGPTEQVGLAERHGPPSPRPASSRLASNTGQRGSDIVTMRWSDIEHYEGRAGINVTQMKTGLVIWVPFTRELEAGHAHWERRPTYLTLKESGMTFVQARGN